MNKRKDNYPVCFISSLIPHPSSLLLNYGAALARARNLHLVAIFGDGAPR
jgi:hypothetical protein